MRLKKRKKERTEARKRRRKVCKNGILEETLLKEGTRMDNAVKTKGIKYVRYEVYPYMVKENGLRWVLEAPKDTNY